MRNSGKEITRCSIEEHQRVLASDFGDDLVDVQSQREHFSETITFNYRWANNMSTPAAVEFPTCNQLNFLLIF